jgi:hypothetical protein
VIVDTQGVYIPLEPLNLDPGVVVRRAQDLNEILRLRYLIPRPCSCWFVTGLSSNQGSPVGRPGFLSSILLVLIAHTLRTEIKRDLECTARSRFLA